MSTKFIVLAIIIILLIFLILGWKKIMVFIYKITNFNTQTNNTDDPYLRQMKDLKYDTDLDTAVVYHNLGNFS